VDWLDEHEHERKGLDLRGADLRQVDLSLLPLARLRGGLAWDEHSDHTTEEQYSMAAVHLEGANLYGAHLEGVRLNSAYLEGANLGYAHLERADLIKIHLEGANLEGAFLTDADLGYAHLAGANLSGGRLGGGYMRNVILSDEKRGGPRLVDIRWGDINLAVVKWAQVKILGDEYEARQKKRSGKVKARETRLNEYENAVRANRQLAVALQAQGLNEDAARFAYRAQKLQRIVLRRQHRFGQYLFSLLLDVFAGYGYKPERCFFVYVLALAGFTVAHYIVGIIAGPHLSWLSALAVSIQSLHGRIFSFQPGDPQTLLNTIEAFVGLFIEAIVVAIITQRILGKS